MKRSRSLQARLALSLGVLLTVLWLGAAWITGLVLRHEMDEVFDSALQETAQRLLPLAVLEILGRDDDGVTQHLGAIRTHGEFFTYIVRDAQGRILLQSHAADPADFPPYDGGGFRLTDTHRIYNEDAVQGDVRISVAAPLKQRAKVAWEIQMVLGLPILVVIPIALLAIILAVRASLAPLRRFRETLAGRNARDLSPVPVGPLPAELVPVAATLNAVLGRLNAAFEAERSFAANAAHEFRTPLAGAIAQAQRLQVETKDPQAVLRAAEIETALKRLTRMAERLLQLARAEGGPLRLDHATDLRTVARVVVQDLARANTTPIRLALPDQPLLSDLDPDAFGILCRNLVENALRHGTPQAPIDVTLTADGSFSVANDGPLIPAATLDLLTQRFERGGSGSAEGSGLGLAIVAAIADRISTQLRLRSPRPGAASGFEASLQLPTQPN